MGRATDIPHRVYTAEFKSEAVKLADEVGITEAAKRLDLQTTTVRDVRVDAQQREVIPYSAILYDTHGDTWTYLNPAPLTFIRHAVKVDHITGDQAFLAESLAEGTSVVTVGSEELFGSETEFQEE